jgi:acyl-CoA synthetase (NDP forming)
MRARPAIDGSRSALDRLFRARSVALVGATERSIWSQAAFANFERIGFTGRVHPVSRKGGVVHGLPAATSCAAIGAPVDAALLMVPEQARRASSACSSRPCTTRRCWRPRHAAR